MAQHPQRSTTTTTTSTSTTTGNNNFAAFINTHMRILSAQTRSVATAVRSILSFKRWDVEPSDDDRYAKGSWRDNALTQWWQRQKNHTSGDGGGGGGGWGGGDGGSGRGDYGFLGGGSGGEDHTVKVMIAANFIVFGLWQTYGRERKGWDFMTKHFSLSWSNLDRGRYHVLLTHAFSQQDLSHFIMNSITLWYFGQSMLGLLGRTRFLGVFFGSVLTGAMCQLVSSARRYKRYGPRGEQTTVGSSAGGMGLSTTYACMFPTSTFYLIVLPLPAWLCVGGLVAYDAFGAMSGRRDGIAHYAHLGGAAFGALYYLLRLRR